MKIIMTDKFRGNLVTVLNLIKYILVVGGVISTLFFACGLDGESGDLCIKLVACSEAAVFVGMFIEMFTIKFLVHDGEHIEAIFDFNFYGLKSRQNYLEYRRELKRQMLREQREREKQNAVQQPKSNIIKFVKGA